MPRAIDLELAEALDKAHAIFERRGSGDDVESDLFNQIGNFIAYLRGDFDREERQGS